jgi:hypothetical protein
MHVCMCVYIHVYISFIFIYIKDEKDEKSFLPTHICMYVSLSLNLYIDSKNKKDYIYIDMYVCAYIIIYISMDIYMCVYIDI